MTMVAIMSNTGFICLTLCIPSWDIAVSGAISVSSASFSALPTRINRATQGCFLGFHHITVYFDLLDFSSHIKIPLKFL